MTLSYIPSDTNDEGILKATASGVLPNGQPVVVNADGTVSVAGVSSISQSIGTASTVNTQTSGDNTAIYDSANNKVVVFYRDEGNSNYGTAAVGTVNGTTLSFGSEVVFASEYVGYVNSVYDVAAGKAVVFYSNASAHGRCNVGTVSGTSISFGSQVTVTENTTYAQTSAYDPVNQKIVLAMQKASSGECLVCTVSGSSLSTGTEVTFDSQTVSLYVGGLAYNPATGKFVLAYRERGANNYGEAIVGTVSGTSISFGAIEGFNSANTQHIVVSSDPTSNHVVIYYKDTGNSLRGEARVGTITGTSIAVGSLTQYSAGEIGRQSATYNVAAGKHVIFFADESDNTKGFFSEGTVSGTSVSFTSPVEYEAGTTVWATGAAYISDEKVVVNVFSDNSDSGKGKAIAIRSAYNSTNLTSENYIGMSGGAIEVESGTQAIGSPAVFESASSVEIGSAYDANAQRVVVAYRDGGNSNYGTAVVGTVSGTSISFGTPVVFESAVARYSSVAYDANAQKVVIAYKNDGNNESTAIVGTVSGTTISFGTAVVFGTASSNAFAATYDTNAQKVVIAYMTTNDNGIAIVGTISGTSISFGTPTQLENSRNSELAITYDANAQKVVVAYKDLENSNYGTAVVGTVSGTSISFGTPAVFNTGTSNDNSIAYDANAQKVVISYVDGGNSSYGTAIVGTVSGTSISFGSAVVFESGGTVSYNSIVYDPTAKRVVNFYRGGSVGKVAVGNVSGTSISFDTPSQFESGAANHNSAVYDSNTQKVVVAYEDGGNSGYGTSVVFQTGYTNINRGQVADGGAAITDIIGTVSRNQVGLTAGQAYYVQTDGTIGTTPDDPSVFAGTAISATKLIVKT